MAYVTVPKDLNAVKSKVLFNLTKRQLVFFGAGALVGVALYFSVQSAINTTNAITLMIAIMFPFFLFGMYEKNGQNLETILKQVYLVKFASAKNRPYESKNFYSCLETQYDLNKEVHRIVNKRTSKQQAKKDTKKAN